MICGTCIAEGLSLTRQEGSTRWYFPAEPFGNAWWRPLAFEVVAAEDFDGCFVVGLTSRLYLPLLQREGEKVWTTEGFSFDRWWVPPRQSAFVRGNVESVRALIQRGEKS
jgi:hypothetical protein